jgi:hypothetical protein
MLGRSAAAVGRQERKAYVEAYLSPRRVRRREAVPRASATIRAAFSRGLEQDLD